MSGQSESTWSAPDGSAGSQQARRERFAWLATLLAHRTLRFSAIPGRGLIGWAARRRSRARGGHPFAVRTSDGVKLEAWYSPASPGRRNGTRLPVVMSHGWIEVKECHFRRARQLNRQGHDVVLFDHRAHGRSGGRCATFGVREREDLRAVIDEAIDRGLIGDRMITMGFSMGAATVLGHAAADSRVTAVVAIAPFSNFRTAVDSFRRLLAPWMSRRWLLGGFERATLRAGWNCDEACMLEAINRIKAPILLVEGGCDINLPPAQHTQKLVQARTCGSLEVLHLQRATHVALCRRPWRQFSRALRTFCNEAH